MSYSYLIENDHIYVKYAGLVDGLDIVQLTADKNYIKDLRRLQRVIHDFSFCEEVSMSFEDLKDFALLSNMESHFTEKAVGVIIPKSQDGYALIEAFANAVKSPDWMILTAKNYTDALTKI